MEGTVSLAKKLAEVVSAVKHPPQSGHNKFHRYDYSTRDDIFGVIRGELSKRGVVIVPSVEEVVHHDTGRVSKGGAATVRFNVRVRIIITDGEEEYVSAWWGESHTEDDKGIQQAVTQALRFWATNTFMLLDGSDEQMYGQAGTQTDNVRREESGPTLKGAKVALANRLAGLGYDADQQRAFAAYVASSQSVSNIDEVPADKLQRLVDSMVALDDAAARAKVNTIINQEAA